MELFELLYKSRNSHGTSTPQEVSLNTMLIELDGFVDICHSMNLLADISALL